MWHPQGQEQSIVFQSALQKCTCGKGVKYGRQGLSWPCLSRANFYRVRSLKSSSNRLYCRSLTMKAFTLAIALVGLLAAHTAVAQSTSSTYYCAGAEGASSPLLAHAQTTTQVVNRFSQVPLPWLRLVCDTMGRNRKAVFTVFLHTTQFYSMQHVLATVITVHFSQLYWECIK